MSDVQMGPAEPIVSDHFQTREQQDEASFIGMWLFLAQEIMFFGGLFLAYSVYRFKYPDAWAAGSAELNVWQGGGNTVVLLVSSLTMAMTVYSTQMGRWRDQIIYFSLTAVLGIAFLVVKAFEYTAKWQHGLVPGLNWNPHLETTADMANVQLFFVLYFTMTGMHALHMVIGIGLVAFYMYHMLKRHYGPNNYLTVELFGFYWHFVDIVWVFLFPMMYLIA